MKKTSTKTKAAIIAAIVSLGIVLGMIGFIIVDEYNVATKQHNTQIVYDYGEEKLKGAATNAVFLCR